MKKNSYLNVILLMPVSTIPFSRQSVRKENNGQKLQTNPDCCNNNCHPSKPAANPTVPSFRQTEV
jgi:hypothetical protein